MEFLKHLPRILKVLDRFPCVVFVLESSTDSTSYSSGSSSNSTFSASLAFLGAGSSIAIWNILVRIFIVLGTVIR